MKTTTYVLRLGPRAWLTALGVTAVLAAGYLTGLPDPVPTVHAVGPCKVPNGSCAGGDTTKTSVLEVNHATTDNPAEPVLPDASERWAVQAWWAADGAGLCDDVSETAYVTVAWTGSGWAITDEDLTANIVDIDICDAGSCSGDPYGMSPSRRYRLRVDIEDPVVVGLQQRNLREVIYTTVEIDDGVLVTSTSCDTGTSVSPTSQTFSPTDSGTFECTFVCTNITGPLVTITYD